MQDALFHQHLKTLHADKHSGQSISLILHNAIIWTGEDKVIHADNNDARYAGLVHRQSSTCQQITDCVTKFVLQVPFSEALAVQSNGSIVAVGSSTEVMLLQQPATQVTNLQGAFVMPASTFILYLLHCNSMQWSFC